MHQGRLAGAVVSDQAEALALRHGQVDTAERTDGAELLFDAVELDDCGGGGGGHVRYLACVACFRSCKGRAIAVEAAIAQCVRLPSPGGGGIGGLRPPSL